MILSLDLSMSSKSYTKISKCIEVVYSQETRPKTSKFSEIIFSIDYSFDIKQDVIGNEHNYYN